MPAEHPALEIDDVARLRGARPELLDHRGIGAARHEADVLAVRLVGDGEPVARRQRPGLGLRREPPEREAQEAELLLRRREQEVALVPRRIGGPVQLRPGGSLDPAHVVPGRHEVGLEVARGLHEVAELHPLVAADAGHRRRPGEIGVGELLDHRLAEPALVVEHVVREADRLRDPPRVVDVAPGAAGALPRQRRAMVVELQRDADDVMARLGQHGRDDRAVDAPRHRHDHARRTRFRLYNWTVERWHRFALGT